MFGTNDHIINRFHKHLQQYQHAIVASVCGTYSWDDHLSQTYKAWKFCCKEYALKFPDLSYFNSFLSSMFLSNTCNIISMDMFFCRHIPYDLQQNANTVSTKPSKYNAMTFVYVHPLGHHFRQAINSLALGGYDYSLKLVNFKLISTMNILCIFCEIAIKWMPQHPTDH